ncbi:MAG: retron St85 family RNA-directed DNA polymerase [Chloroflexota bacterium]|nr:retron St85 family RNA-directed DNA polymerase [Chloroflexota bacterium]
MSNYSDKYRLALFNLPLIDSLDDFSNFTHISKVLIYKLSKFSERYYKIYRIPKRGDGFRVIRQPNYQLKAIQGWILRNVLKQLHVSSASKGFQKETSIKDNVSPHIRAKVVMCLDLDDFYTNIHSDKIWYIFRNAGYSKRISLLFTSLCTYDGFLPQGAPTSPKLSNLACWRLDQRLIGLTSKNGIIYTRYADDLTLSANSYLLLKILPLSKHILRSEGFKLNKSKTRIMGPSRQQKITGLILNQNGFGIGRRKYRELRASIHKIYQFDETNCDMELINRIQGWLSFTKDVDEKRYKMLIKYLAGFKQDENNYLRFIYIS